MYFTNWSTSNNKFTNWYDSVIASDQRYLNRLATSNDGGYFCEHIKVTFNTSLRTSGMENVNIVDYTAYTPQLECDTVGTHGKVNTDFGLLTYDELVFAGGYRYSESDFYLDLGDIVTWTMSPGGYSSSYGAYEWKLDTNGRLVIDNISFESYLRPVINLNAQTIVSGSGSSDSHWVVTN